MIAIEMLKKCMTVANMYAPNSGCHPEFFQKVIIEVVLLDNTSIVIGGDWNVALNPKIDSIHAANIYRARSRKQIVDFMNTYDLVGVYRNVHVHPSPVVNQATTPPPLCHPSPVVNQATTPPPLCHPSPVVNQATTPPPLCHPSPVTNQTTI